MKIYTIAIQLFLLSALTACLNKTQIKLPESGSSSSAVEQLNWNYLNPTVLSGEMIPFAIPNGTPAYTTNANGIGVFDSTTLEYTPPLNYAPTNHTLGAADSVGKVGSNNVKIIGFQAGSLISLPQSFGDQNFPSSSVTAANGDIYVSATVMNSPGWEIWVIYKSSDNGATWNTMDTYAPNIRGESHPMAIATKGNDIYVCGYQWVWAGAYNSEWLVRKSSNGGSTWSNVDEYHDYLDGDHVCFDIAVDSVNGNIYTVGYDTDSIVGNRRPIIRQSLDDGATWTTIGAFPGGTVTHFISVEVAPSGTIWAVASDGKVYRGTYALGVWNWAVAGTTIASTSGVYELRGDLELVSETTAYFSGNNNGWKISKTTDSGASWATVYNGANTTRGQDITRLTSGELVATGYFMPSPLRFVILTSTDNGASWTETYNDNSVAKQGITLTQASDSSVLAFGQYDNSPYQIITMRSTDAGASWSQRSEIRFWHNLWSDLYDLKVDGLGNLWAVGFVNLIDNNLASPWVVMKSSDDGVTWQESDVFTNPGFDSYATSLTMGMANEIYVAGNISSNRYVLRKSVDSGATWTEIDSLTRVETVFGDVLVTVASNGDVFYAGTWGWPRFVELRKGAAGGTLWTSPVTFPIGPDSSEFVLTGLKAFDDGSLWISGIDSHNVNGNQNVIYRSTDNGVSFTEVLRENGNNNYQELKRMSNGDIYAISNDMLKKTSDNGATWSVVYDGTVSSIVGYAFDFSGRLYVLDGDDIVQAQNQFNSSWFKVYDYSLLNTYNQRVIKLSNCGNSTKVCLLVYYENALDGSLIQMYPLTIP